MNRIEWDFTLPSGVTWGDFVTYEDTVALPVVISLITKVFRETLERELLGKALSDG